MTIVDEEYAMASLSAYENYFDSTDDDDDDDDFDSIPALS